MNDSRSALPVVVATGQNPPATGCYTPPGPPIQDCDLEKQALPLSHYLWVLRRHVGKIALFVLTCVVATFIVSSRLQQVFEATATVDVDLQAPSAIVGQDSNRSGALNDADQFLATQVRIIQSDAVLRPVALKYDLLKRERQIQTSVEADAERATKAPVLLKGLKVTRPNNTYLLLISYRSPDAQFSADVANAITRSYLEHTYDIRVRSSASLSTFMERQLEELKAKMERSGEALAAFERELNVINPEEKTSIISARLLQLNTEYTNAEADRVRKESAWNSMQSGSLEAAQISGHGESLQRLNEKVNEARERFAEIKTTYGASHPEYRKAASQSAELQRQFEDARRNISQRIQADFGQASNREQMLRAAVSQAKEEFDRLNSRSFQYQQVKREAEGDKKFYEELVRKIKEADINAGFQNNNIRIADVARPGLKPVFPNLALNLLCAFLFSLAPAVAAALIADATDTTIRDPEQTSRYLGADVVGTLPAVKNMAQICGAPGAASTATSLVTLDVKANGSVRKSSRPLSSFDEAIRTLRSAILLGEFDRHLRSILVTSANPSEGKTTSAVHLAIAHSDHKKTLLIDADLRRPGVHRKLQIPMDKGMSDVLTGTLPWREAIIHLDAYPNLSIIPAGPPSHRATDLIGPMLADLLDEFAKEYDLVIIDSPPLLGFAEPMQMATIVDGALVVCRAGATKRKSVLAMLSTLRRLRANVIGVVINQVKHNTSDNPYYYAYHRPDYYLKESA